MKVIAFLGVGSLAFAIHYSIAFLLNYAFDIHVLMTNFLGYVAAFFSSYFGHKYVTFNSDLNHSTKSLYKFTLMYFAGFITGEFVLYILTEVTFLAIGIALLLALMVSALQSYMLMNLWVFKAVDVNCSQKS